MWWHRIPQAFHVVRDETAQVAGFYLMFDPATIDQELLESDAIDPIVARWWNHLTSDPVADNQRVLFLRRWLSRAEGESPGSVQAACWLDIKRTYLELSEADEARIRSLCLPLSPQRNRRLARLAG